MNEGNLQLVFTLSGLPSLEGYDSFSDSGEATRVPIGIEEDLDSFCVSPSSNRASCVEPMGMLLQQCANFEQQCANFEQDVVVDSFGLSSIPERWHVLDLRGLNLSKEAVECSGSLMSCKVTSDKGKSKIRRALVSQSAASSRALGNVRDGIAVVTQLGRISEGIVSTAIWLVEGLRQREKPVPGVHK